jgi:hypothetical protein
VGGRYLRSICDLYATTQDNGDLTYDVRVAYKDGHFTTIAGDSPGACSDSNHHGLTVLEGIEGDFQGWVDGTVTGGTYNPNGCEFGGCTDRTTLIMQLFGPTAQYNITSFNFEYYTSDGSASYRHWQDKSHGDGGEKFEGDIASD